MMRRLFVLMFAWLASLQVFAMQPENGWWYNPAESGRGYNIEIQNNIMGLSIYTFEPSGVPVYYMSAGRMTSDRQYSGDLDKVSNGQCTGCSYRAPQHTIVGKVSVSFDSPTSGVLTMTGNAPIRIQRLGFGIDLQPPGALLGEWATVTGSSTYPVYFGERFKFDSFSYGADGHKWASGSRSGDNASVVTGAYFDDGYWFILMDASTDYYAAYQFSFSGFNTIEGRSWVFLKTSTLSGAGLPFLGTRVRSAAAVTTGVGPGTDVIQKVASPSLSKLALNERNRALAAQQEKETGEVDPAMLQVTRRAVEKILGRR